MSELNRQVPLASFFLFKVLVVVGIARMDFVDGPLAIPGSENSRSLCHAGCITYSDITVDVATIAWDFYPNAIIRSYLSKDAGELPSTTSRQEAEI
ncbi:MAG TPA: hypothetical protein VG122_20455 [Gemmata sp.]|nr:hypothetical protein [Gemmata sp.]